MANLPLKTKPSTTITTPTITSPNKPTLNESFASENINPTDDNVLAPAESNESPYNVKQDFPSPPSSHSINPLHLAAQRGDLKTATELINSNTASPTDLDHDQITPLHWSAINGHLLLSSYLISRGAIVDAFGGQLMATPLMWAARNARFQIVHLLLKNGADPNLIDSQAFNTLHLATHSSSALTLSYLLSCAYHRINIDSSDREGHTALHWACYQGDSLSVELLISHRASIDIRDANGMTPLHWAVVKGNSNCIRQIIQAGADVMARTIDGKTPQDMAIELKSNLAWSRGLAQAGLNPNGTRRILPLGTGLKMKVCMYSFTIICFGLVFQTIQSLPYYSSIIFVLAQAYGAHHIITNTILDASRRSPGSPSEIITASPYFSTLIVASFFWVGYAWIAHVLPRTQQDHPSLNLFFILSSLICIYNFIRSVTLDPGYIPLPRNQLDRKTIIEGLVENGKFDGMNFCITCENRKPLRSKHCKICQRCIGKFDHHCPWVWNCVGVGNHRQFIVFVGTLVMGVSLFDILALFYFMSAPEINIIQVELPASCSISKSFCRLVAFDSFTLSIVMWASLQLIWTIILLASQLWLVSKQMTTSELSNVNRFGYMGGRGGTSMAPQSSHSHSLFSSQAQASLHSHHHSHHHGFTNRKSFLFCLKVLGLDRFLGGTQLIKKSQKAVNPFNKGIRNNCLDFWSAGDRLGVNYLELFEVPKGGFQVRSRKANYASSDCSKPDTNNNNFNSFRSNNGNRSSNSNVNGYERVAMDVV